MPNYTQAKNHNPGGIAFDTLDTIYFPIVSLAESQSNSDIAAILPLPTNFKVFKVVVVLSGTLASTLSVNVVVGPAAEGSVGTNGEVSTSGTIILAEDSSITMTVNDVQALDAAAPDAICPADLVLTLRTVTSSSTTGNLTVGVCGKWVDPSPTTPLYGDSGSGSLTF